MRVKYKGFKGHDGEYDLGSACLLLGENDAGKSSLVAAVHFALAGKLAAMRMGKGDTQDPGRLLKAIDDGGWSEVELAGSTVRRTLEATEKKARVLTTCDGVDGKDGEAAAARLAGDLLFADFRRLVAAGDKERADVLATYLPQPADAEKRRWALGQMLYHIHAALRPQKKRGQKTEPESAGRMDQAQATDARNVAKSLAEANKCNAQLDAIFNHIGMHKDDSTEDMIEAMRTAANVAEDERKSAGKVAAEAAKAGTGDKALAKEIPALEAQVNALRAAAQSEEGAKQALDAWQTRVEFLSNRVKELHAERSTQKGTADKLTEGKAKVAHDTAKVEEVKRERPGPLDMDALRVLTDRARPLHDELARLSPVAGGKNAATKNLSKAEAALAAIAALESEAPEGNMPVMVLQKKELDDEIARWKADGRSLRERRDAAILGQCPLILAPCPTKISEADQATTPLDEFAKEAKKTLDLLTKKIGAASTESTRLGVKIEALQTARDRHNARQTAWAIRHAAAKVEVATAKKALDEAKWAGERIPRLEAELEPVERETELLTKAHSEYHVKFTKWTEALTKAEDLLTESKQWVTQYETAAKRADELASDQQRVSSELEGLHAAKPTTFTPAEVDGNLPDLEAQLQAAHTAKARAEVLGRLNVDALTFAATLRKAAYNGAAEGLTACVQAAAKPICGKITEALHKMDVAGEFYVDLEARSFGLREKGKPIDVEVLGGGKAVLFAAAMLSALPAKGGPRVLTLEGAELHTTWMPRLLRGLDIEAFDAVVVATCHTPKTIPDGWIVIDMGAEA